MVMRLLSVALAAWMVGQPAAILAQGSTKELLNRAQSEADKRAVEELVDKLKSRVAPQSPPTAAPVPAAPTPAPKSAAPASTPPPLPSASLPPVSPEVDRPTSPEMPQPPQANAPPVTAMPSQPPQETPALPSPTVPPVAKVPDPQPESAAPAQPDSRPAPQPTPSTAAAPFAAEQLDLPRVDIEVFFALDSADVSPVSIGRLAQLGRALADPRLRGAKFVIAGHTDAFGPAEYNLTLSHRRAEAVRRFLIERFSLDPDALIARGYGSQVPKVRRNPFAPENRRVQIINWTVPASSEQR